MGRGVNAGVNYLCAVLELLADGRLRGVGELVKDLLRPQPPPVLHTDTHTHIRVNSSKISPVLQARTSESAPARHAHASRGAGRLIPAETHLEQLASCAGPHIDRRRRERPGPCAPQAMPHDTTRLCPVLRPGRPRRVETTGRGGLEAGRGGARGRETRPGQSREGAGGAGEEKER